MNFPYLKQTAQKVADAFGLSYDDGVKIVGFYSSRGNDSGVDACAALDLETIKAAADAVGVALAARCPGSDHIEKSDARNNTQKTHKKPPKKPENIKDNKTIIKSVNTEKKENTNTDGAPGGVLPSELFDVVRSIFENFCNDNGIESMEKAAQSQFSAACMVVGQYMKQNKILWNIEKTAERGGVCVYDPQKVDFLVDIWAFFCALYKKTPFIFDFIRFSGVSESWLSDNAGHGLTSSGGVIKKKVQYIQESGIASSLADGRVNPTGLIYLTKARMGWSENAAALILNEKQETPPDGLPVFDGSKLLKSP